MTDRIRAISEKAHELTRKTRQGLDGIGDEVRTGNKRTTQVAEAARRAVEVATREIATLNAATIEQTRQIEQHAQPHQRPVGRDPEGHQPDHRGDAVPGHHAPEARALHKPTLGRGGRVAGAAVARDPRAAAARPLPRGESLFAERLPRRAQGQSLEADGRRLDEAGAAANAAAASAGEMQAPRNRATRTRRWSSSDVARDACS